MGLAEWFISGHFQAAAAGQSASKVSRGPGPITLLTVLTFFKGFEAPQMPHQHRFLTRTLYHATLANVLLMSAQSRLQAVLEFEVDLPYTLDALEVEKTTQNKHE